jgi:hypothetical protein
MAGKAILAMGKAVVRGAEYLVITRRLSTIKAIMPCSDDDLSQHRNPESIFDDLLELSTSVCCLSCSRVIHISSRPALYPEALRIQAMQLIIGQIARKETFHLRRSISKWDIDHEELVAFLSEIIGVVLFSKRG